MQTAKRVLVRKAPKRDVAVSGKQERVDKVTLSEPAPETSLGRKLVQGLAYWSRRIALNVAAIPAGLFGVGIGVSPARLTGATELHAEGIDGQGVRVAILDKSFTKFGAGSEDVLGVLTARDGTYQEGLKESKSDIVREIATKTKGMSFHGNAMANIITGEGLGMKGVAPAAEVVGVSIVDEKGVLQTELFVDGLQWVADNHKKQNIKAVSASVNYRNPTPEQREKAQKLVNKLKSEGVAVVVAAGNNGPKAGTVRFPADLESVVSVGASTPGWSGSLYDDRIERYSSRGGEGVPGPKMVAPGGEIFTKDNHGQVELTKGTSNSAPMVAGAIALLSQAYPEASVDSKVDALLDTAQPITGDADAEGHGLMMLAQAYDSLRD